MKKRYHPRYQLLGFSLFGPIAVILTGGHWFTFVITGVAYWLLGYAIFQPTCNWLVPLVTRFKATGKEVWLTIDDGPDGANTERLLAILGRYNAKATFFVIGRNLAKHPHAANSLLAAGHTLGNHTDSHPAFLFWCYPPWFLRREIVRCNQVIEQTARFTPGWFRPPVGIKSLFLQPILAKLGMRLIGWSLKGKDGIVCDPAVVLERIKSRVQPGDIILLHEGRVNEQQQPTSNECIELVLRELTAMGYSFVIPTEDRFC